MRRFLLALFLTITVLPAPALAVDGEVSFSYLDQGETLFLSEVEIGHIMFDRLRPYLKFTTGMDEYNDNGTFHPAEIEYEVGARFYIYKGAFGEFKHSCTHPIDKAGPAYGHNQFKIGFKF